MDNTAKTPFQNARYSTRKINITIVKTLRKRSYSTRYPDNLFRYHKSSRRFIITKWCRNAEMTLFMQNSHFTPFCKPNWAKTRIFFWNIIHSQHGVSLFTCYLETSAKFEVLTKKHKHNIEKYNIHLHCKFLKFHPLF